MKMNELLGVEVADACKNMYMDEFQQLLIDSFDSSVAHAQSMFDLFIPRHIKLKSDGNPSAEQLIADTSFSDMTLQEENPTKARVTISDQGIFVGVEGYGDFCTDSSLEGKPILIEKADKKIRACFWNNINDDDVTDIVELSETALSKNRNPY
jgi:hypothetical protein